MASPAAAKKQQGDTCQHIPLLVLGISLTSELVSTELQLQYTNYKNTLQQLASKIGDVEQEAEEHKFVLLESIALAFLITCCLTGLLTMKSSHGID